MRQVFEAIFQFLEYFATDIFGGILEWIFDSTGIWGIVILLVVGLVLFLIFQLFASIIYVVDAVISKFSRK